MFILGRQPALGLAELESVYSGAVIQPIRGRGGTVGAIADVSPGSVDFQRLGGSIKYGKILATYETIDWRTIEKRLVDFIPDLYAELPEGKVTIGISVYGLPGVTTQRVLATGLSIKKAVKKTGRPVRLVPNTELELNSASVLHNGLAGSNGCELLLVRDNDKTILAQTAAVQDIESYTVRDRGRPRRDARVGMLPPKLAQTITNLAVADQNPNTAAVLDPFCGTGVILQEAGLMGMSVYGTDLDERMVRYSRDNMNWVKEDLGVIFQWKVAEGDATSYGWDPIFNSIASETYLGKPFTFLPSSEVLAQTVSECNLIIKKFLRNIGNQAKSGTRMCLAVPAWQVRPGQFRHLPLVDSLEDLGYNRISFEHVRHDELLYFREDQTVARELLVIIKR